MAKPLTTIHSNGRRYTRRPAIEHSIDGAIGQPLDVIQRRLGVRSESEPDFLPSESLVHLLRDAFERNSSELAKILHARLMSRVERIVRYQLRRRSDVDHICGAVMHDINERLAPRDERQLTRARTLDYYEVNFNDALRKLYLTKLRAAGDDKEEVELIEGIQKTDLNLTQQEDSVLKMDLADAIDSLPPKERRAFLLVERNDLDVESIDPTALTAAKICNTTGKSIRNWRNAAKKKLAAYLENHKP